MQVMLDAKSENACRLITTFAGCQSNPFRTGSATETIRGTCYTFSLLLAFLVCHAEGQTPILAEVDEPSLLTVDMASDFDGVVDQETSKSPVPNYPYVNGDSADLCASDRQLPSQFFPPVYSRNTRKPFAIPNVSREIMLGGWLAQSFTANSHSPNNRQNLPMSFNSRSNDYLLQQLYAFLEVPVLSNGNAMQLGGRIDVLFGSDARFSEMRGIERDRMNRRKWNGDDNLYRLVIPQAYVDLALPVLDGLTIRAGRFYAFSGFETFMAPANFFVSKSYVYANGSPFEHAGVVASQRLGDSAVMRLGYTQGWDSFDSSTHFFGILTGFTYAPTDSPNSISVTTHLGNDWTGMNDASGPRDGSRYFASAVFQRKISSFLRYVFEYDIGYQEDGTLVADIPTSTIGFRSSLWQGIAQYLIYDFNRQLSSALRVEWFNDPDHRQLAVPIEYTTGGPSFLGGDYVEVTGGFNWQPMESMIFRPELRWDWSNTHSNPAVPGGVSGIYTYNDHSSRYQVTCGMDWIWMF